MKFIVSVMCLITSISSFAAMEYCFVNYSHEAYFIPSSNDFKCYNGDKIKRIYADRFGKGAKGLYRKLENILNSKGYKVLDSNNKFNTGAAPIVLAKNIPVYNKYCKIIEDSYTKETILRCPLEEGSLGSSEEFTIKISGTGGVEKLKDFMSQKCFDLIEKSPASPKYYGGHRGRRITLFGSNENFNLCDLDMIKGKYSMYCASTRMGYQID
jgi:hypothetical protein